MTDVQIRLKQVRQSRKYTQKEMANRLGISQQAYQQLEAGKTEDMRISTLVKLCDILNVSADWLLGIGETREIDFIAPSVKRAAKKEYIKQAIAKK